MSSTRNLVADVFRRNRAATVLFVLFSAVTVTVSFFYNAPMEPALYAIALSAFFLAAVIAADFARERKRSAERERAKLTVLSEPFDLPEAHTLAEEDYREMIHILAGHMAARTAEYDRSRRDTLDYYTGWVHQIKTPIAVMRLMLADNTEENRALRRELFRVEQYAEMALNYIRLGEAGSDLLVQAYPLDELICEAVRKFAPQFIEKKLTLRYNRTHLSVITDRKWLVFMLEQLLSNAIKYTREGAVSIEMEGDELVIADTGTGIAPEDLPRIFEKGYTGVNGRIGEQSSGLGLYLVKKTARFINAPIRVESSPGKGSAFYIKLKVDA